MKICQDVVKKKIQLKDTIGKYEFLRKSAVRLTIVFMIGIIAILRANFNYYDDMGRITYGYKGFDNFSRYISYYGASVIHADSYLTDVSPLPQLLAAGILGVSGAIAIYIISGKKESSYWEIIAAIPLGLSPFFLECLSYKFDAPYMAFSVLAAVFPLLFYKNGYFKYSVWVVIGTLAVCMSYQAASGIFPVLVIIIALKRWNDNDELKDILT